MTDDLTSLRREIRGARRELPAAERSVADAEINRRLLDLVREIGPTRVASYLTTDGEPDLSAFHDACVAAGVELAVPVMGPDHALQFRPLGGGPLVVNRSGIPEPQTATTVDLASIDLVIVPLVVFDAALNRAGRGGGWYDRALLDRRADQLLVGVAYRFQERAAVPTHGGDVPLDVVVTDAAIHRRRPSPDGLSRS